MMGGGGGGGGRGGSAFGRVLYVILHESVMNTVTRAHIRLIATYPSPHHPLISLSSMPVGSLFVSIFMNYYSTHVSSLFQHLIGDNKRWSFGSVGELPIRMKIRLWKSNFLI